MDRLQTQTSDKVAKIITAHMYADFYKFTSVNYKIQFTFVFNCFFIMKCKEF